VCFKRGLDVAVIDPKELSDLYSVAVTVWWLGNAGFAINAGGRLILVDPVIEVKDERDPVTSELGLPLLEPLPIRARNIDRADVVLITHDDGDHLGPHTTPALIARTHALFVGTERTARKLREYGLVEDRIRIGRYGQTLRVGDIMIVPTPASHQEEEGHTKRGDCCGFIFRAAGVTFWHPNDTKLLDEHLEVKGVDVLLLPIAPHVLGTEGAIGVANASEARHIIPCHYGTYDSDLYWCTGDPAAVGEGIERAASRYHVLRVGEKLVLPAGAGEGE
jgi:L-ascorbate metabolism protein UlaG (beta-lactamase superfamily)